MLRRSQRALVLGVLAIRATFCVQLVLAIPVGVNRSTGTEIFLLAVTLMLAETAWFAAALRRSGRFTPRLATADVLSVGVVVAFEPLYSSADDRVGTWVGWAFAAGAVGAISAGAGYYRLGHALTAATALSVVYLAVSVGAATQSGLLNTALINAVALVGYACAAWLARRFVYELATTADEARAAAETAARRAELERQRNLLHDQATILSLLSQQDVHAATADALRDQAAAAALRVRAFLADERTDSAERRPDGCARLVDVVVDAAAEFQDLDITLNVDLVRDTTLEPDRANALQAGLRTLLHNVRRHATATSVTVHADVLAGERWELTVVDDGVGFDPARTERGFGLRVQAGETLLAHGFDVSVDSYPGEGTRVTICGGQS